MPRSLKAQESICDGGGEGIVIPLISRFSFFLLIPRSQPFSHRSKDLGIVLKDRKMTRKMFVERFFWFPYKSLHDSYEMEVLEGILTKIWLLVWLPCLTSSNDSSWTFQSGSSRESASVRGKLIRWAIPDDKCWWCASARWAFTVRFERHNRISSLMFQSISSLPSRPLETHSVS